MTILTDEQARVDHDYRGRPEVRSLKADEVVKDMLGQEIVRHQSQLSPAENKFHKGNRSDGLHYWLTPPDLYARLDAEFGFDFDPCPFPLPPGFDGLTCEWGWSNYVNPPFGSILRFPPSNCEHVTASKKSRTCTKCGKTGVKLGPTAWIRKAIAEWQKGKRVVLVYPVDKWVLLILKAILGEHIHVRNLGDVKWLATEDGSQGKGTGRHIACFILEPTSPHQESTTATEPSFTRATRPASCPAPNLVDTQK